MWGLYAIPTDSKGLRGESTPVVQINIIDPTGLSVEITNPVEGQTFQEGDYVTLAANVSSSTSVLEFYDQNQVLVGRRTSAPWTTNWRIVERGNYTVRAKVINSQNQSMTSSPISFVFNPINHRSSGRITDNFSGAAMSGITLNLTSPTNANVTATATTDSNGIYLFTGLGTTLYDGVRHIWNSGSATYKALQWGISTDVPVPGDYDRDGKTDFAIYRKSEGNWYILKSATNSFAVQSFGVSEDVPIPGAFVR